MQLARHGWKGDPADRVTGYRGRNDQMRREHDMGASMRDLGRSYDVNPSAVCRAIKEAKHRAVAVSEAIRAKMASSPAAEVEFLFSVPPVLRTVSDSPKKRFSSSPPLFSTSRIVAKVDNNLPHGQFESWCDEHLPVESSQRRKWMILAKRYRAITFCPMIITIDEALGYKEPKRPRRPPG